MTNFNERTNTLLYKNISQTLYSQKGWCWLCVRGELETGTDCYILTQVLLTIGALLSYSVGLLNRGSLRAQALCLELVLTPLASYLKLTQAVCVLVIFLFDTHLLPLIYTYLFIYLFTSLDWRLGRGSICNIFILNNMKDFIFFFLAFRFLDTWGTRINPIITHKKAIRRTNVISQNPNKTPIR